MTRPTAEERPIAAPAVVELLKTMPPSTANWPKERRVVFLQALDSVLAHLHGGQPLMIWLGEDGDIHIAERTPR